jgi:hypothetical protein
MRIIYTSKEMSKKFGVRVIHYVRVIYRKMRYLPFGERTAQLTIICTLFYATQRDSDVSTDRSKLQNKKTNSWEMRFYAWDSTLYQ